MSSGCSERVNLTTPSGDPRAALRTITGPRAPGQGPQVDGDERAATPAHPGAPTVHTHLAAYSRHLRAAGVSPGTLRLRLHYLERLAETLGPDLLAATPGDLEQFLGRARWAPETRKSARATLLGFYRWATDEDLVEVDPARRLPPVRVPRPMPRPVPLPVFAGALRRADDRGRRALTLMRYAGLRRAEVAALHERDVVDLADGTPALLVRGKGRVIRAVPLHPRVAEVLAGVRGHVFPSSRTASGHITPDALGDLVSDLLGPGWSGHTLRHRAAADWYAVDRDLRAVQELLGHADVRTTQLYTPVPAGAMTRAVLGVA